MTRHLCRVDGEELARTAMWGKEINDLADSVE